MRALLVQDRTVGVLKMWSVPGTVRHDPEVSNAWLFMVNTIEYIGDCYPAVEDCVFFYSQLSDGA